MARRFDKQVGQEIRKPLHAFYKGYPVVETTYKVFSVVAKATA